MLRNSYDQAYFESVLFRTTADSPRTRKRIDLILSHKTGGELLEIGCAKGHLLQLAASHFSVSGVEVSEYATQTGAEEQRDKITIADVQHFEIPSGRYDVVVAFNVLEHLQDPAVVLRGIGEGLKPDGVFIGSVPLNHSLVGGVHTGITNVLDRTHRSTFSLKRWRREFTAAGFLGQDVFGEIQIGPNRSLYVRTPLWEHLSLNLMFVLVKVDASASPPDSPARW